MEISEPRLRALLRQANRVASAGKRAAAAQLYRQIIDEAPQAVDAWVGLAEVEFDEAKKEIAYRQALALDPDNQAAQNGLLELQGEQPPADENDDPEEKAASSSSYFDPARDMVETLPNPPNFSRDQQETAVPNPLPAPVDAPIQGSEDAYELACYRHPDRFTALRCYTCDRPICSKCAVKTPVGYRCPICIREAEDVFYNATPIDYVLALLVSFPLSLLAGFLITRFSGGFFFILIAFFLAGIAGRLIGSITKRVVGFRRGRYLPHVVAAMVIVGVLLPATPVLLFILLGEARALFALLVPGIYLLVAPMSAFYQMK